MTALVLASIALATPADDAYRDALMAWTDGQLEAAADACGRALALAPDHPEASLLDGLVRVELGDRRGAVTALAAVVDDEAVGRLARRVLRRVDLSRRDLVALQVGAVIRNDRDTTRVRWVPGLAGALSIPVASRWSVRADVVTPVEPYDRLQVYGPKLGVAPTLAGSMSGSVAWDAGLGPSLWLGTSDDWNGRYHGIFPGFRAFAGIDVRAVPALGARLEVGFSGHVGARSLLRAYSWGVDARLVVVGFVF